MSNNRNSPKSAENDTENILSTIRSIILQGRVAAGLAVNRVMIDTYWLIGKHIIEEEQHGMFRAEYGSSLMEQLGKSLTSEFGPAFNSRNLFSARKLYIIFPNKEILNARVQNLTWTHAILFCMIATNYLLLNILHTFRQKNNSVMKLKCKKRYFVCSMNTPTAILISKQMGDSDHA